MSNKNYLHLNPLDTLIRETLNLGMRDTDTYLQIEYIYGFELFNTRPYHNYETFAGGYRITDKHNDIRVEAEDLDDALRKWAAQVKCMHDFTALVPNGAPAWQCKLCNKRNPEKQYDRTEKTQA